MKLMYQADNSNRTAVFSDGLRFYQASATESREKVFSQ